MLKDSDVPVKNKNLRIIDHIGTLYATINGSSIYKIDKAAFAVLKLCDGRRTVKKIVEEISRKIGLDVEQVRPAVLEILEELIKMKFVEVKQKI